MTWQKEYGGLLSPATTWDSEGTRWDIGALSTHDETVWDLTAGRAESWTEQPAGSENWTKQAAGASNWTKQ